MTATPAYMKAPRGKKKKMSDTKVVTVPGIGFLGLLGVLFIGLKLTGFINWSWLWVLAPLWIVPAGIIAFILFCLFMAAFCTVGIALIERYGK